MSEILDLQYLAYKKDTMLAINLKHLKTFAYAESTEAKPSRNLSERLAGTCGERSRARPLGRLP